MSNLGWTEFDILNANQLYVSGQPFTTYIANLIANDNLEQAEIDEIKAFLARLNLQVTAPNTLTITNENRNAVLKTAIDLINSRLQYYNGTALSEEWIVNNGNKNAVLLAAIQALQSKTNLLDSSSLSQSWVINDSNKNATLLNLINQQVTDIGLINSNLSTLNSKTQYISSAANSITLNTDVINIGQFNALVPSTQTNLRGDIYTNQAYFKSLNTSSIFGWNDFITLINASNLPSYVSSAAISIASSFMPSDVLRMNGSVTKDGDIQTTNDIKCNEFKLFNTSVIGFEQRGI
jgi:hypothetical protein